MNKLIAFTLPTLWTLMILAQVGTKLSARPESIFTGDYVIKTMAIVFPIALIAYCAGKNDQ